MSESLKGGCACGAIRYEASAEPKFSFHCQCRQCQRATGGGHSSLLMVPTDSLTVSGDLTFYETEADSGNHVSHGFCGTCGSPLISFSEGYPENRYIMAGSLDDPASFTPQKVIFSDAAQPWDHVDPALLD